MYCPTKVEKISLRYSLKLNKLRTNQSKAESTKSKGRPTWTYAGLEWSKMLWGKYAGMAGFIPYHEGIN